MSSPSTSGLTRTGRRLSGFDGLRAVAAFEVLSTHVLGHAGYWWLSGRNFGTSILFMMSGFLLYRPHARAHLMSGQQPSVRIFLVRRALRIFPAYWLVLLIVILITPNGIPDDLSSWLQQILILQDYTVAAFIPGWENMWSLGTEVAFYAFLPLGAWLLATKRGRTPERQFRWEMVILLAVIPLSYGFRIAVLGLGWINPLTASFWLPSFAAFFAGGMAFAVLREWNILNPDRRSALRTLANDQVTCVVLAVACFGIAATALGGTTFYVPITVHERLFRETLIAGTAVFLMLPSLIGTAPDGPWSRFLNLPLVCGVGAWAYGIYLWHLPVIVYVENHLPMPAGLTGLITLFCVTVAVTLPLAWLTHVTIEQPAINLSHRLTPVPRKVGTATPAAIPAHAGGVRPDQSGSPPPATRA